MCKILEQYSDKIKGVFAFFDRTLINGYIRPLMNEHSRSNALYSLGILYKDYKSYFSNVTQSIITCIEDNAVNLGRPVIYLPSARDRKEDIAKKILSESPVDSGLVCVLKSLESCKTARVYGSDTGKLVVKSCATKCLHYYLYCLDEVYGFMFIRIQTWFPFNI